MAYLNDAVLDNGLVRVASATTIYILSGSADPITVASVASVICAVDATTPAAPSDRGAGEREVIMAAVTAGTVTVTTTATRWALCSSTVNFAVNTLSTTQAITSGNTFTLAAFTIGIPDGVSA